MDQPVTIYAESHAKLREMVRQWLNDNKPLLFGNASPSYEITRRVNYSYSPEGWRWVKGDADDWVPPQQLWDFDGVVNHFVEEAMIVEKGPGYQGIVIGDELQLHLVKTIKRESDERRANDMLRRGWCIIGLEYKGSTDWGDRNLVERRVIFVLGHPEENAS
jgi:hypothetical protein